MCSGKRLLTRMNRVKETQNMTLGNGYKLKTVGHESVVLDIEPAPRSSGSASCQMYFTS